MKSFLSKVILVLKIIFAKISGRKHKQKISIIKENFTIENGDNVIVYSSYYSENCPEYIIELLKALLDNDWKIVLVLTGSTKGLENLEIHSKKSLAIIQRSNVGLDFGSFLTGLEYLNKFYKDSFILTLMNDSIIPLYPKEFVKFITKYSHSIHEKEIHSMTDSYQYSHHLQSFFLIFLYSEDFFYLFRKFMRDFIFLKPKYKNYFINQGEIRFSKFFRSKKYKLKPIFDIKKNHSKNGDISLKNINPTHDLWHLFKKGDCAFIKKDIFMDFSYHSIFMNIAKDIKINSNPFLKGYLNDGKC